MRYTKFIAFFGVAFLSTFSSVAMGQSPAYSDGPIHTQAQLEKWQEYANEKMINWLNLYKGQADASPKNYCAWFKKESVISDDDIKHGRYENCESVITPAFNKKYGVDENGNSTRYMCYQGMCLGDSIQKLTRPVLSDPKAKPPNTKPTPELMTQVRQSLPGISDSDARVLIRNGIFVNEMRVTSDATLNSLKSAKEMCKATALYTVVTVKAENGKDVLLTYIPMTVKGNSHYRLGGISMQYPEVSNEADMKKLAEQASDTMKMPLKCESLGSSTQLHCNSPSEDQEFNVYSGVAAMQFTRQRSSSSYFSPAKAAEQSACLTSRHPVKF